MAARARNRRYLHLGFATLRDGITSTADSGNVNFRLLGTDFLRPNDKITAESNPAIFPLFFDLLARLFKKPMAMTNFCQRRYLESLLLAMGTGWGLAFSPEEMAMTAGGTPLGIAFL